MGFPTAIATGFIFGGLASQAAQESIFSLRGVFSFVVQNVLVESFYRGDLTFQQAPTHHSMRLVRAMVLSHCAIRHRSPCISPSPVRRSILRFLCRHALPLQIFVYVPVDNKHGASYVFAFVNHQAEQFRRCSFQLARTCKPDLAGSEDFERHASRYTKFQLVLVVFYAWSRRGRVGFRPTSIFGLRSWPFVLGVRGWFQVVVIGIVMLEIDIFASSTGEFNIITLDHFMHCGATVFYED